MKCSFDWLGVFVDFDWLCQIHLSTQTSLVETILLLCVDCFMIGLLAVFTGISSLIWGAIRLLNTLLLFSPIFLLNKH